MFLLNINKITNQKSKKNAHAGSEIFSIPAWTSLSYTPTLAKTFTLPLVIHTLCHPPLGVVQNQAYYKFISTILVKAATLPLEPLAQPRWRALHFGSSPYCVTCRRQRLHQHLFASSASLWLFLLLYVLRALRLLD